MSLVCWAERKLHSTRRASSCARVVLRRSRMDGKFLRRIGFAALLTGVFASGSGCAAQRDPIDRVQPNAIPKSFFIGAKYNDSTDDPEFYARTMVIDVPYGESGGDWGLFTNSI